MVLQKDKTGNIQANDDLQVRFLPRQRGVMGNSAKGQS